jgi:EAL domain-containing protein (putative c-di-GMP-specific phosphodiesterase class I)
MIGAEALMRWTRPGHGAVPPGVFIPIAEETGRIVSMGAWLLGEACCEAVTWPVAMRVAVNVSPLQIRLAGFLDTVRGALAQSGLDPHRLELEVTEGILIRDTEETLAALSQLRAIGVRLAMDDFGTGYASLGYLQKFRFDKIKIDQSFVKNAATRTPRRSCARWSG